MIEQRRFLRTAGAEVALMVAIVAVTAVLVSRGAREGVRRPDRPGRGREAARPARLNLVVDPAKAGRNAIHLYLLKANGQPATVAEANLSASLPSRRIGPLRFTATRLAPGHYAVYDAHLAIPRATGSCASRRGRASSRAYTTHVSDSSPGGLMTRKMHRCSTSPPWALVAAPAAAAT